MKLLRSPLLGLVTQCAKRNRIAGALRGRYAVLPLPTHRTTQHVDGAWLQSDGDDLPFFLVGFEWHACRIEQRDADNDSELWRIAMPPDWRAGWILQNHSLDEGITRKPGECRRPLADLEQEIWKGFCGGCPARAEVVFQSVFDRPPSCGVAVELEYIEMFAANSTQKSHFIL